VAVDTADVVGAAFGLKAIPVSFLVDEVGIVRLQGGGPSKEFRAQVEEVLREPVSAVRGTHASPPPRCPSTTFAPAPGERRMTPTRASHWRKRWSARVITLRPSPSAKPPAVPARRRGDSLHPRPGAAAPGQNQ